MQDWWSVGKRLAARATRADMGETSVMGDATLHEGMWMQIAMVKQGKGSVWCLWNSEPVIRCRHYAES